MLRSDAEWLWITTCETYSLDILIGMNLTNAQIGFIRAIGVVILTAVLSFLGDSANLNGVVSAGVATLISALALSFEHALEANGKGALFGAAK